MSASVHLDERADSSNSDVCATSSLPYPAVVDVPSPGPRPSPGKEGDGEEPLIRALFRLHKAGEIPRSELDAQPVYMPKDRLPAGSAARAIADDMEFRFRLLLTEGVTWALMYSLSEAVRAGHVRTKQAARYAMGLIATKGVARCVGEMPPQGKGNGTRLWVPPGWTPDPDSDPAVAEIAFKFGAVPIELSRDPRIGDLVWLPEGEVDGSAVGAVDPDVEVDSELPTAGTSGFGRHAPHRILEDGHETTVTGFHRSLPMQLSRGRTSREAIFDCEP